MIETKTIFTKKKKPHDTRGRTKKKRKVKLERKRKKTLEHPQKHVCTLIPIIPSIRTSALIRTHPRVHPYVRTHPYTRVHPYARTHPYTHASIRTSALIHTHTRPSALPSKFSDARLTFLPADCWTEGGSVLPPSAGFFSASSADSSPSKRVWRNGVIIGRKVKDKRERGLPGR